MATTTTWEAQTNFYSTEIDSQIDAEANPNPNAKTHPKPNTCAFVNDRGVTATQRYYPWPAPGER